jgi:hypothetical protein
MKASDLVAVRLLKKRKSKIQEDKKSKASLMLL